MRGCLEIDLPLAQHEVERLLEPVARRARRRGPACGQLPAQEGLVIGRRTGAGGLGPLEILAQVGGQLLWRRGGLQRETVEGDRGAVVPGLGEVVALEQQGAQVGRVELQRLVERGQRAPRDRPACGRPRPDRARPSRSSRRRSPRPRAADARMRRRRGAGRRSPPRPGSWRRSSAWRSGPFVAARLAGVDGARSSAQPVRLPNAERADHSARPFEVQCSSSDQAFSEARSTLTPGPMVELSEMRFT